MNRRVRRVNWTLNNPTEDDVVVLKGMVSGETGCTYIVFQEEEGGLEETRHLQGYAEFDKAIRMMTMKKWNPTWFRMHLEMAGGEPSVNRAYCIKDDTRVDGGIRYEEGTITADRAERRRGKGGSNLASKIGKAIVQGGKTALELREEYPGGYLMYRSNIAGMIEDGIEHPPEQPPRIDIYWSYESGTGKSYKARQHEDSYAVPWPTSGGVWWWPFYNHEETVILDEFRHQLKLDTILRLFDYGNKTVQVKGGQMKMTSRHFIVTTNMPPHEWYPGLRADNTGLCALMRRLTEFATIYRFRDNISIDVHGRELHCKKNEDGIPMPELVEEELGDWDYEGRGVTDGGSSPTGRRARWSFRADRTDEED